MTVPAGIEVTQTVERTLIIRDLVIDLDADIPCQLVDTETWQQCENPARWSLLFDGFGFFTACDPCKDQCVAEGGAEADGQSARLLEVRPL